MNITIIVLASDEMVLKIAVSSCETAKVMNITIVVLTCFFTDALVLQIAGRSYESGQEQDAMGHCGSTRPMVQHKSCSSGEWRWHEAGNGKGVV